MEKQLEAKYFIVVLLVLAAAFLFFYKVPGQPYKVVGAPEQFPTKGTTISHYKNLPPGFPPELVLESELLATSEIVAIPGGKKQIIVSYVSKLNAEAAMALYVKSLPAVGWNVSVPK